MVGVGPVMSCAGARMVAVSVGFTRNMLQREHAERGGCGLSRAGCGLTRAPKGSPWGRHAEGGWKGQVGGQVAMPAIVSLGLWVTANVGQGSGQLATGAHFASPQDVRTYIVAQQGGSQRTSHRHLSTILAHANWCHSTLPYTVRAAGVGVAEAAAAVRCQQRWAAEPSGDACHAGGAGQDGGVPQGEDAVRAAHAALPHPRARNLPPEPARCVQADGQLAKHGAWAAGRVCGLSVWVNCVRACMVGGLGWCQPARGVHADGQLAQLGGRVDRVYEQDGAPTIYKQNRE